MDISPISVAITTINSKTAVKAIAEVTIGTLLGEITLREFVIMQTANADPWVAFPSKAIQRNGQTVYVQFLEMRSSMKKQLQDLILSEWKQKTTSES